MSKNQEERANYYLYINGQAVPVSEQVYRAYQHYERKEEYFSYDLKTEKFQKETASFLPSREDSYERLLEKDRQFAASGQSVEKMVVSSVWLEEILSLLTDEERQIIEQLYIFGHTEREACSAMARLQRHSMRKGFSPPDGIGSCTTGKKAAANTPNFGLMPR